LVKRIGWFGATKTLLALLAFTFATSITVSSTTYQADVGSSLNVTNFLRAMDKGFYKAGAGSNGNGTSCSSPVVFRPTPSVASTDITSGDLIYDVQVYSTSSAMADETFTVTFLLEGAPFGPICIKEPLSPVDGQTIDCMFDIGTTSLPSSPYSFRVIIQ